MVQMERHPPNDTATIGLPPMYPMIPTQVYPHQKVPMAGTLMLGDMS